MQNLTFFAYSHIHYREKKIISIDWLINICNVWTLEEKIENDLSSGILKGSWTWDRWNNTIELK